MVAATEETAPETFTLILSHKGIKMGNETIHYF